MQITGLLGWHSRWASPASAGGHRVWPRGLEGSHMPRSTKPRPPVQGDTGFGPRPGRVPHSEEQEPRPPVQGDTGFDPGAWEGPAHRRAPSPGPTAAEPGLQRLGGASCWAMCCDSWRLHALRQGSATGEGAAMRRPCTTIKTRPHLSQLEKTHTQQFSAAKNNLLI